MAEERAKPHKVTATDILMARYGRLARPVMLKVLNRNSCIASSKITAECLSQFGLTVTVQAVKFAVTAPSLKLVYAAGLTEEERSLARENIKISNGGRPGWDGHVVAIVSGPNNQRYLVDAAFDQASLPDRGMTIPPCILILPIPVAVTSDELEVTAQLVMDNGLEVKVQYLPTRDNSFMETDAWYDADTIILAGIIRNLIIEAPASL